MRRTVSTLSRDTTRTLLLPRDPPPPPVTALGEVDQPAEVAADRRRLDPARDQRTAGPAVVVGDIHGEVGEERLELLQRAAAPRGRAALEQRVHEATVGRRRQDEWRRAIEV